MTHETPPPPTTRSRLRAWAPAIGLVIGMATLAVFADLAVVRMMERLDGAAQAAGVTLILIGYTLLMATPFVPGIAIVIPLLMLNGPSVAPYMWGATVGGLLIAYAIGRALPPTALVSLLMVLRQRRMASAVAALMTRPPEERLDWLASIVPPRFRAAFGNGRYAILAILINLPGAAVIGGGGGISMMAGYTRLFPPLPTVATIILATAPFPLLIWIGGPPVLDWLGIVDPGMP